MTRSTTPRSLTVGVEIETAQVRAVVADGADVLWAQTEMWGPGPDACMPLTASDAVESAGTTTLSAVLTHLFDAARVVAHAHATPWARLRHQGPAVHVALSPAFVQVKRLSGLPPVADDAVLAEIVRENVGQFFVTGAVPLLTGGVRRVPARPDATARNATAGDTADVDAANATAERTVWAAAYVSPVVCDVIRACVATRLPFGSVAPTAVVLGSACQASDVRWGRGATAFAATYVDGALTTLDRRPGGTTAEAVETDRAPWTAWDPALGGLGPAGAAYAAAFGAARHGGRDPVSLVPRHRGMRHLAAACARPGRVVATPVPRARLLLAGAACALGLASAAAAPGLAAVRAERAAADTLRALGPTRARAAVEEASGTRAAAVLDALAPFEAGRRSSTVLLGQLARDLPPGAAIVDIRLDSVGGTLIALTPHVGDLVRLVERLPAVASAELVGSLVREPDPTERLPTPVLGVGPAGAMSGLAGGAPPNVPPMPAGLTAGPLPPGTTAYGTSAPPVPTSRSVGDLARVTVHFRFRAPQHAATTQAPAT